MKLQQQQGSISHDNYHEILPDDLNISDVILAKCSMHPDAGPM
jgi:hypothetical protein